MTSADYLLGTALWGTFLGTQACFSLRLFRKRKETREKATVSLTVAVPDLNARLDPGTSHSHLARSMAQFITTMMSIDRWPASRKRCDPIRGRRGARMPPEAHSGR